MKIGKPFQRKSLFYGDLIRDCICGKNYGGSVDQTIHAGLFIVAPGFIDLEADIDTDHALIDIAHPDDEHQCFSMEKRYRTQVPLPLTRWTGMLSRDGQRRQPCVSSILID